MKNQKFKFELGSILKDKITGFTGTVTGRAQYITGCSDYALLPKAKSANEYPETKWMDEGRLELVKEGAYQPEEMQVEDPGCDTPKPEM